MDPPGSSRPQPRRVGPEARPPRSRQFQLQFRARSGAEVRSGSIVHLNEAPSGVPPVSESWGRMTTGATGTNATGLSGRSQKLRKLFLEVWESQFLYQVEMREFSFSMHPRKKNSVAHLHHACCSSPSHHHVRVLPLRESQAQLFTNQCGTFFTTSVALQIPARAN